MIFNREDQSNILYQDGFTLMEVMVTMAITSILALSLATAINQITTVSRKSRKLSKIRSNLYFAMSDIVSDLRKVGRQTDKWSTADRFRLVGQDNDGTYDNSDLTDNRLSSATDADTLFFNSFSNDESVTSNRPDRKTVGYFLSTEETNYHEQGTWRLVRYNRKYKESDLNDGEVMPPIILQPLQGDEETISTFIDRLSFRYRDEDGTWYNSWDSHDLSLSPIDNKGEIPVAVEIAIRAYDSSEESKTHMDPEWQTTMITLKSPN